MMLLLLLLADRPVKVMWCCAAPDDDDVDDDDDGDREVNKLRASPRLRAFDLGTGKEGAADEDAVDR